MKGATRQDRFQIMKCMNYLVKSLNNEEAYYDRWIYLVPDEADDEDLMYIAEHTDLYREACELFRDLVAEYGGDGFYAVQDKRAY